MCLHLDDNNRIWVRSHEDQNEEDQKFWLRFGTEKTDGFYCVEFHVSRAHVTAKRYQSLLVLVRTKRKMCKSLFTSSLKGGRLSCRYVRDSLQ